MKDTEESSVESFLKTRSAQEKAAAPVSSDSVLTRNVLGPLLWISGVIIFGYAAFGYDTTVSSGYAGEVVNIGLVSNKILIAILGAACFCAGTAIQAISTLSAQLKNK